MDLAIRNGTVVTADRTFKADIGIEDGRIAEVGSVSAAADEIDATGLKVLPGGVDPHTHLETQKHPDAPRSPSDYFHGTVAAACGGITTVVDYARQYQGLTLEQTIEHWSGRAARKAVIDYAFHISLTDFTPAVLSEIPKMVGKGFPTYKIFMHRVSEREMLFALRSVASAGGLAMMHCESQYIEADTYDLLLATGRRSARYWAESHPKVSEAEPTSRALDYATYTGCPIYVVHVSCADAVNRLRRAKSERVRVWVETRPCYLLFTKSVYENPTQRYLGFTGYPPMRDDEDIEAIWRAVQDGTIDIIGSDHSAWSLDQKAASEDDLAGMLIGLPALETESRAIYSEGVAKGRLSENAFVALTATNPAIALGLFPQKGTIMVGSDADLVLWNPRKIGTIRESDMHGDVGYEPCDGMECTGWPVRTISRGETIVDAGRFVGKVGRGRLLTRHIASAPV